MATTQQRHAEFNRLLVEQATVTRDMKYDSSLGKGKDWGPIQERAARLVELAELLRFTEPEKYVNERIAAWIRMNPLPLSMERIRAILTEHPLYSLAGGVAVSIGDLKAGGYQYRVMADDFAWSGARVIGTGDNEQVMGDMVLRIPDSVAEHFRQQGYRKRSREIANTLGFKLDY
jgi:hypothetical protein